MLSRNRTDLTRLGWGLCLLLLGSLPATSQPAPAITVSCEIVAPSLTLLYGGAATKTIQDQLCRALTAHLAGHRIFSLWRYQPTVPGDAILRFQVVDGPVGETLLQAHFLRRDALPTHWRAVWRGPGEAGLGGDAPAGQAAGRLAEAFTAKLLERSAAELEAHFKKIPLAGARWVSGAGGKPRLVSSLPWQDYQRLRASRFRVACHWPARDLPAYLESRGVEGPGLFQPAGVSSPYQALMLAPTRRIVEEEPRPVSEVVSEVLQLEPKWVFFQEYQDPDMEVFAP